MTSESRKIVWRLRLLTTTGLLVVAATLTVVGMALWRVRAEREPVAAEQHRLAAASDKLRRFSTESRNEIQATLDGVEAQSDVGTAALNFQRSVRSELNSHPDAAVLKPLTELDALVSRLIVIEEQADEWRSDYEGISDDIREQRSIKKLRGQVAQIRSTIAAAQSAKRSQRRIDLDDQLTEFGRLVEVLAGEEQTDALDELKNKQIKPLLDSMALLVAGLAADPGGNPAVNVRAIEDLRASVLGKDAAAGKDQPGAGAGGLYVLRRDALLLRRQREKLKTECALLFEDIDFADATFAQSAQGRGIALTEQIEQSLSDSWRRMLIFAGACSGVFLWLSFMISRGIYWQVNALEVARQEAETGRQVTHKLMLEQQAGAAELESLNKRLVETSRQAGMAEVATGVLHNVGNVLNSVNVSSSLVTENLKKSRLSHLGKVVALLRDRQSDLGSFMTSDPTGKQIPGFLAALAEYLAGEQSTCLKELAELQKNIEHIKDIVAMQQAYAGTAGFMEPVDLREMAEDAIRIHLAAMTRHDITVVTEYGDIPRVLADKHKVLQILVNLVSNAKHAMKDSNTKTLTIRIDASDGRVRVAIRDTGYGIGPENLTRIFAHGFTTKKGGHGFGLHSGALAAKEIGGSLNAQSDGPGHGAQFTLELPAMTPEAIASR